MSKTSDPAATLVARARIAEAFVRMGRAMHQATIYPDAHPAVPASVAPFLETFRETMEERDKLVIGIASDRLILDGEALDERNGVLSWMAHTLYERGIGAVEFGRQMTDDAGVRFVLWLAKLDGKDEVDPSPPKFDGITLTHYDLSRLRFGEQRSYVSRAPEESLRVWRALMTGLIAGWDLEGQDQLTDDPEALARTINQRIALNEGVGTTAVAQRVIALGAQLPSLPEGTRRVVKERLGTFIGSLTPDLRSQLLRVDPRSSAQKLEFLAEMVEALPDSTVVEVLGSIDKAGLHVPHQLITLMNKLIRLASRGEEMTEKLGDAMAGVGIPKNLLGADEGEVRGVLTEVFQSRLTRDWNPARYQERLEELSIHDITAGDIYLSAHYADPRDTPEVSAHLSQIALRLLVARPEATEAPSFLRRLDEELLPLLEIGRYDRVHQAATAVEDIARQAAFISPDLERLSSDYLAQFKQKECIEKILNAAEAHGIPVSPHLIGLFHFSHADGIERAFRRLTEHTDGPEMESLTELIIGSDFDDLVAAVARMRPDGWGALRVLFPILMRIGGPRVVDFALTFLGNEEPHVRTEALRILLTHDDRPGQAEKYLERSLADESPKVVGYAISHAKRRGGPGVTSMLGAFVRKEIGERHDDDIRLRAIGALAAFRTVEARDILLGLLSEAKVALFMNQVRLTSAIEEALLQIGDEPSLEALHSWRKSRTRFMSMLLVEGKVKTR